MRAVLLTLCALVVFSAPVSAQSSPDGTTVPPAASITDAAGTRWTRAADGSVSQNGTATGGTGTEIAWIGGHLYVHGSDAWYQWMGSYFAGVGPTRPVSTIPVIPVIPVDPGPATLLKSLVWTMTAPSQIAAQSYVYTLYADTAAAVVVHPTCGPAIAVNQYPCTLPFPSFTPGAHTLTVTAGNVNGTSPKSTPFPFTFAVLVPAAPTAMRVQ